MRSIVGSRTERHPAATAGFVLTYRPGYTNFCPGCGQSHWHVGRVTAECARCMTALPIALMPGEHFTPPPVARTGWRAMLPMLRVA